MEVTIKIQLTINGKFYATVPWTPAERDFDFRARNVPAPT